MATPSDIRLKDPLSDVTRKERRTLLGVSALGIVMVKTGLVPTKISALGIDFSPTDQKTILQAVAVVVIYFLVAFITYAASDFLAWRHALALSVRESMINKAKEEAEASIRSCREITDKVEEVFQREFGREMILSRMGMRPVSTFRALFEFALPILVGGLAVVLLLR